MRLLVSRHLENFLALYEAGNMHVAADKKGVTQPALTKSLKLLEEDLGVELFRRGSKGLDPTDAADTLYRHARAIDQEARFASLDISELHANLRGMMRIGVGPVVAVSVFPAALMQLHKHLPAMEISVETGISDHLLQSLSRKNIDVVVAARPSMPIDDEFSSLPIHKSDMLVICRKYHLLLLEKAVTRETLTAFKRVGFVEDKEFERRAQGCFGPLNSSQLKPVLQTTSLTIMFGILENSDYYAIVSDMIVARARREGLDAVGVSEGLWQLDIELICKTSLINSRPVVLLRQCLAG